jgi:four helix bundle protein
MTRYYQDLLVWQKSMDLVDTIYNHTGNFPKDEIFGLTSQIRRSAVSIPSNIAEGHARSSTKDFLRFISIGKGSLAELETQLLIAVRREYIALESVDKILNECGEVNRMLTGLQKALKAKIVA